MVGVGLRDDQDTFVWLLKENARKSDQLLAKNTTDETRSCFLVVAVHYYLSCFVLDMQKERISRAKNVFSALLNIDLRFLQNI